MKKPRLIWQSIRHAIGGWRITAEGKYCAVCCSCRLVVGSIGVDTTGLVLASCYPVEGSVVVRRYALPCEPDTLSTGTPGRQVRSVYLFSVEVVLAPRAPSTLNRHLRTVIFRTHLARLPDLALHEALLDRLTGEAVRDEPRFHSITGG